MKSPKAEPFRDKDDNWHNADGSWATDEQAAEYQRIFDSYEGAANEDDNEDSQEQRPKRGRPPGRRPNTTTNNTNSNRTLFTVLAEIRDAQEKLDSLVNELNDIVSPLSRLMGVPLQSNNANRDNDDHFQSRSAAKQSSQAGIPHKSSGQGRVTDPEHDKRLKPETRQHLMEENSDDDDDNDNDD